MLGLLVAACAWALYYPAWRRWHRLAFVAGLVGLSFLAHVVVACAGEFGFGEFITGIIWDRGMGPYFKEAKRVRSAGEYMATLRERVKDGYQHSDVHPAGPVLLFYGAIHAMRGRAQRVDAVYRVARALFPNADNAMVAMSPREREVRAAAFLLGMVLCLCAALAVAPTYWLALKLCGERGAVLCAGLVGMLPSAMLFSPGMDQVMPVLSACVCVAALGCGVNFERPRRLVAWSAALGVALYAAFFFSLAFLVPVAMCGVCALGAAVLSDRSLRSFAKPAAVVGMAAAGVFLLLSLALWLAFRYNTFSVLWGIYKQNDAFNLHSKRTYWKWLLVNPVQFIFFSGCSVSALIALGLDVEVRDLAKRGRALAPCVVAFVAVMALLWVSGKNLGEVERLWVFAMPLAAVAGAAALTRKAPIAAGTVIALLALQAFQVVVFRACFDVYGSAGYFRMVLDQL